MHILANLLKEYDVMTMHLYQVLGKKKLTVQKLHTQLKMFYTTSKKANNWGDTDTALNVQNFTSKKSFKGKCSTCGKQGHKSADSLEKEIKGKCSTCGKQGHKSADSLEKEKNASEVPQVGILHDKPHDMVNLAILVEDVMCG